MLKKTQNPSRFFRDTTNSWGNFCEACSEKSVCVFLRFADKLKRCDPSLIWCKEFSSGESILTEGAPVSGIPMVCRGIALVSRVAEGHEVFVHIARPGFILDLSSWRLGNTSLPCSAEALGSTAISFFRSDLLKREAQQDAQLAWDFFNHTFSQLRDLEARYMKKVGMSVRIRIVYFLLELADFYAPGSSSFVVLPLKLPRRVLVKAVGAAEETVSRIMTDLIRQGLIQKSKEALIIPNVTRLRSLLPP